MAPAQVSGPAAIEVAWTMPTSPIHVGATVPVEVLWTPTAPQPPDLKASLRLLAVDGRVVWQRDRTPQDGSQSSADWALGEPVPDRFSVQLPADLTPGSYTWQVVLYDGLTLAEQRVATLGPLQVVE